MASPVETDNSLVNNRSLIVFLYGSEQEAQEAAWGPQYFQVRHGRRKRQDEPK